MFPGHGAGGDPPPTGGDGLIRLARTVSVLAAAAGLAAAGADAFPDHLFVVTSDGSAGNCTAVDLDPPWTSDVDLEPVGAAPRVRHFFGLHYVVDRSSDGGVRVVDPETFDTVAQYPVGGSPRDILVVDSGSAYVTRYDAAWLLEIHPTTGAVLDSVDLGGFADPDGIPEMSSMARDGCRVFVQIQRRDFVAGPPFAPGLLAVVDVDTNTLIDVDPVAPGTQAIELVGLWPDHDMQVDAAARRLYVSTPGPRLDVSGGIEEIDLDSLDRVGFVLSEEQASVDIGAFVVVSATKGYFVGHTDIVESSHLTAFSRPDSAALGEVHTTLFATVESLAFDESASRLFYPEPNGPGIHVFDTNTDARLTESPVPTGTGPVDLVIARGGDVGAPPPPAGALAGARAFPNPTTGAVTIELARSFPGSQVTIHDARGALVSTLEGPPLRWDGRDARGERATAGVYFFRVVAEGPAARGRLVVVR